MSSEIFTIYELRLVEFRGYSKSPLNKSPGLQSAEMEEPTNKLA